MTSQTRRESVFLFQNVSQTFLNALFETFSIWKTLNESRLEFCRKNKHLNIRAHFLQEVCKKIQKRLNFIKKYNSY